MRIDGRGTHYDTAQSTAPPRFSLTPNPYSLPPACLHAQIEIMRLLKGHPHVVAIEEVFEDAAAVHIVMELCTGGDLTDHISRCVRATSADA